MDLSGISTDGAMPEEEEGEEEGVVKYEDAKTEELATEGSGPKAAITKGLEGLAAIPKIDA